MNSGPHLSHGPSSEGFTFIRSKISYLRGRYPGVTVTLTTISWFSGREILAEAKRLRGYLERICSGRTKNQRNKDIRQSF